MLENLEVKDVVMMLIISLVVVGGLWFIVNIMHEPSDPYVITAYHGELKPIDAAESVAIEEIYTHSEVTQLKKKVAQLESTLRYYQGNPCTETGSELRIEVFDMDEDPISEAKVNIRPDEDEPFKTYFTDDNGILRLRNVIDGCYNLKISKSGHSTKNINTCLKRDKEVEVHLGDEE